MENEECIKIKKLECTNDAKNLKFVKGEFYVPNFERHHLKVYMPDDTLILSTTYEEDFVYIQTQIKLNKINGCYMIYKDVRYNINADGRVEQWSNDIFSVESVCNELLLDIHI